MGTLLRLLLFALALYLIVSGLRRLLPPPAPRGGKREKRQEPLDELMVQDPQCGRFVPMREALPASLHGRQLYFCSQSCRDLYLRTALREH
ncbi:MAG: hypothetical protein NZ578_15830 [Candidatus Binatia bacterium]|nr:hypothetical protein [Candidatus Binatia bacterium]